MDFDGVLNHDDVDGKRLEFEKDNVANMRDLLRRVPADIVVISAWRKEMSVSEMNAFFRANGLPSDRIVSKTSEPQEKGGRGREITIWLDAHPDVKNYVIIDDNAIDLEDYMDFLVKPTSSKGLTKKDVDRAEMMLSSRGA